MDLTLHGFVQQTRPLMYQAGQIALDYFKKVKIERKEDKSFVTVADREIERFLREEIHCRFPDHGFVGEESGHHQVDQAELVWAIDPIDGTAPFVYDLPVWGISVGLLSKTKGLIGFVYLPVVDEMYWAMEGGGAFVNDQPIQVHGPCDMVRGTCIVAPTITFRGLETLYDGRAFAFGSAAAHMCYVARGKIHGGILKKVRLWDIAASWVIVREAGGVTRYLSGNDVDLWELIDGRKTPEPFVIGHPENAEQLRRQFSPNHS